MWQIYVITIVALFVVVLIIEAIAYFKLKKKYLRVLWEKRSMAVRHGKMWEQYAPLIRPFPGNFKFLGEPIDGVSFEDDRVVLVEIKTGGSSLSETQRRIKNLVEQGKVEFKVLRY